MNTKAENRSGNGALDIAKYLLALLIASGGVYVFYAFPQWPGPIRGLLVAFSFALALLAFGFTANGQMARKFFSDALFELRKVVWPTREETYKITAMVLVVVVIISLILAGFDWLISIAVKFLLGS
jgi:preprotein translocase subunit SecE